MSTLIYPHIPAEYLDLCTRILQRRHMETVFEERAVQSLCAQPTCGEKLNDKLGKFRVSLTKKEIYEADHERQFCSKHCMTKARVLLSKLTTKPPQLLPSIQELFGTNRPNPFQFQKQMEEKRRREAEAASAVTAAPKAKSVWAKTGDLGIVERPPSNPIQNIAVPTPLASAAPVVRENSEPAAPEREFPDTKQAVLIEGYVFPAHKQRLAKKVEKLLQQKETEKEDELVVSDSDESDAGSDASSYSSFELTDDEEGELLSTDSLPLFADLWRMMSDWVTHETTLLANKMPLPQKPTSEEEEKKSPSEEAATRAARRVYMERLSAFQLVFNRLLPQTAPKLQLSGDPLIGKRIFSLIQSFAFPDPVDGRESQQWICTVAILLLVAHEKRVKDCSEEEVRRIQQVTNLDAHELEQLVDLFFTVRDDSDVVVDTDTKKLADADDSLAESKTASTVHKVSKNCRKCRRTADKCVCQTRVSNQEEFSADQITEMMNEALTLREQHEEFLEAADLEY
ncbi:TPA: hypothetical protein N0F65_007417 [Lagenidium giganteum]|uniref:RNA polymerase II subunit B1 CTD phosphatase RPAP2 homolog n=1 Tax=Lagenidium giganteum TaxID=4803 RepID=A0AAV2ZRR6_9STRA|nr:TPA: hypothetical protein N0F65_007417 [Lagenidium giganteum]